MKLATKLLLIGWGLWLVGFLTNGPLAAITLTAAAACFGGSLTLSLTSIFGRR